jgi:hypothetical protein
MSEDSLKVRNQPCKYNILMPASKKYIVILDDRNILQRVGTQFHPNKELFYTLG